MFRVPKQDPKDMDVYKSLKGKAAMEMRLKGMQPVISIAGHPFFVEIRLMKLSPKDNFMSKGLDLNYGGTFDGVAKEYSFYYNKRTMEEAYIDPDITKLPKNVVLIKIPNPYALDPVMMGQINKDDSTAYIGEYPVVMYREAEVIPLEKTELAQLVERNKQRALTAKLAKGKAAKKTNGSNKGNKYRGP